MSRVLEFSLPASLNAKEPPELRGSRRRDGVRLLVLNRRTGRVTHSRFDRICDFLVEGDLLVFNASRTLPALLVGRRESDRSGVELRLASHLSDDSWLALVRNALPENCPVREETNSVINFDLGLSVRLESPHEKIPWHLESAILCKRLSAGRSYLSSR
jgi:S-adenosylmethionine:tRNA ribosyltransferase-isomerase